MIKRYLYHLSERRITMYIPQAITLLATVLLASNTFAALPASPTPNIVTHAPEIAAMKLQQHMLEYKALRRMEIQTKQEKEDKLAALSRNQQEIRPIINYSQDCIDYIKRETKERNIESPLREKQELLIAYRKEIMIGFLSGLRYGDKALGNKNTVKRFYDITKNYPDSYKAIEDFRIASKHKARTARKTVEYIGKIIQDEQKRFAYRRKVKREFKKDPKNIASLRILRDSYDKTRRNEDPYWHELNERVEQERTEQLNVEKLYD